MSELLAEAASTDAPAAASVRRVKLLLALAWAVGHFALGAWFVTLGSYIKSNTGTAGSGIFSTGFVGVAATAAPLGAILAPFLAGLLADRFFSTERIMFVLHALAAAALAGAIAAKSQHQFYLMLIVFQVCFLPTMSLLAAMSMHHLPDPRKQYPLVRGCGTIGWIVAGILVGSAWPWFAGEGIEHTSVPMKIGVVAEVVAAGLCLLLPRTPPSTSLRKLAPTSLAQPHTGRLFQNRQFIAVLIVAFLALIPSPFYSTFANPFLNWRGVPQAASRMTLGQFVEVGCMIALPAALLRIGLRNAVLCGAAAWALRYALLAGAAFSGGQQWALYGAIALHGVAYTFVSISLQIETEVIVDRRHRATAQGLLAATTSGLGSYVGAHLASIAETRWLPGNLAATTAAGWGKFWLVSMALAVAGLIAAMALLPAARRPAIVEAAGDGGDVDGAVGRVVSHSATAS